MSQLKEPDDVYVWDGSGKYAEELEHLHAPEELTAFIKEKAAVEEKNQRRKRIQRKIYLPIAAAAVFAVMILSFPLFRKTTETEQQMPVQPYLGSAGSMTEKEEGITLQQTAVLPVAFLQDDAWTEEMEGVQVKFVQKDGKCIAAFAGEAGYTVASRETEDFAMFREEVRLLLQNGGSVDEDRK